MIDLLLFLVKSIVLQPEKVKIDHQEDDNLIKFSIHVAKEDKGMLIGKNGKVINAIRAIIKSQSNDKRIDLIIAE